MAPDARDELGTELRLLLELTARRPGPTRIESLLDRVDWHALLAAAHAHGVESWLAAAVERGGMGQPPAEVARRLAQTRSDSVLFDRVSVVVLGALGGAFARAGIPWLLLKGSGIAERLHQDPSRRPAKDIDVLVRPEQLEHAIEILRGLGYEPQREDWYRRHHFHVPCTHPGRFVAATVEVHWDVTPPRYPVRFDTAGWWDGARRIELRAGPALVPPAAAELAHLAWHALNEGGATIARLADIDRLCAAAGPAGTEQAFAAARAAGAAQFLRQALALCAALWPGGETTPAPRPSRWLARRTWDAVGVVRRGQAGWWPLKHLAHWALVDGADAGVGYLARRAVREVRRARAEEGLPPRRWDPLWVVAALAAGAGLCALTPRHPFLRRNEP
ncbi:MAG: nucleotidyltransferase family protein [Acidobacteria bacterium]|nr:nucleotidyltransferase family protein [Acidobacteriota bacterium]